jgi:hypothetical protein
VLTADASLIKGLVKMYIVITANIRGYPFFKHSKQAGTGLLAFLRLSLSLSLNLSPKQLRDSHLCWLETSIDGCPFFLFFVKGHIPARKMS